MRTWLRKCRLGVVFLLLSVGLGIAFWQPLSPQDLMSWAAGLTLHPLTIVALVILQVLLHAFALPGSLMLWVFAPLFTPPVATFLLTTGSVLGALAAYAFVRWIGTDWQPGTRGEGMLKVLEKRQDFLTQLIFRVLPGFPHSVMNYGGGMLRLPLKTYLAAATLGLSIKWLVYAKAVHALFAAGAEGESIDFGHLLPLIVLTLLLALGAIFRKRLMAG